MIITRIGLRSWVLTAGALLPGCLLGQLISDLKRPACPEIIASLVPQRVFKTPTKALERVEIRSCGPGWTENLQFVAWENGSKTPSLVVTTSDETIVQLVMSGGVFVFVTTGGSHEFVFVIVYDGGEDFTAGKPRLALQTVTKDPVVIRSDENKVTIDYPNLRGEAQHVEYSTGRGG